MTATRAIKLLDREAVTYRLHSFDHGPRSDRSFGMEAAEALGVDPARVFKTLVVAGTDNLLVVIPVANKLSLKAAAHVAGHKKCVMADVREAERVTGYVHGGISPLGTTRSMPLLLESSATRHETIFVSAGRRGLDIELAPADLLRLTSGLTSRLVV